MSLPSSPSSFNLQYRSSTSCGVAYPSADGVHHYDEYGYLNLADEPPEIQQIHGEMILFVTEWLKEWNATRT